MKALVLSTNNYRSFPSRKQRFARRLVERGYDVLYVEAPVTWLALARPKQWWKLNACLSKYTNPHRIHGDAREVAILLCCGTSKRAKATSKKRVINEIHKGLPPPEQATEVVTLVDVG